MSRFAVYDSSTGVLEEIVFSLGGVNLEGRQTAEAPDDLNGVEWDPGTRAFVINWTAFDAALHAKVDREAGQFRLNFITESPGQQLTYQRKESEARAYVAATDPVLSDYPFIAAEASATGQSGADAAAGIIAAADLWSVIGSAIEGARIAAKAAVIAATTKVDKEAAAAVDWQALLS